jgi:hypothetical protein
MGLDGALLGLIQSAVGGRRRGRGGRIMRGASRPLASSTVLARPLVPLLAAAALTTVACSSMGDSGGAGGAEPTQTPTSTVTVEVLSTDLASTVFLAAVCPTETHLHRVENVAITAGGWTEASSKKVSAAANRAISSVRRTAETLTAETRWDPTIQADVQGTIDEFLALATPLQELADAKTGSERVKAWSRVEKASRVVEQRLRIALGLGLARTKDDGCPPPPRVSAPKPPSESTSQPVGQSPVPATGPLPLLTGPQIESTSDAICYLNPYSMPPLIGPSSDAGATRIVQIFAVMNGINPGPIDGQYGPNTVAAVMQLQRIVGVVADGQVGPITWGALQRFHCSG